jgi:hypothetical protein
VRTIGPSIANVARKPATRDFDREAEADGMLIKLNERCKIG